MNCLFCQQEMVWVKDCPGFQNGDPVSMPETFQKEVFAKMSQADKLIFNNRLGTRSQIRAGPQKCCPKCQVNFRGYPIPAELFAQE